MIEPKKNLHIADNDHVAILMCTYQGERFLVEQIESILSQTHQNWSLWVSDDGSTDRTIGILKSYKSRLGEKMQILSGPRKGHAKNFLYLACHPKICADYYAFADQDDVWNIDKLERALRALKNEIEALPLLYCSRTRLIDETGKLIGYSPLFSRPPGLGNALVQSLAGGNTMVFNDSARRRLCEAGQEISIVAHDWWMYIVVTACAGVVKYDPLPTMNYRQHDANAVGDNRSWVARAFRFRRLLEGEYRNWVSQNLLSIHQFQHILPHNQNELINQFSIARNETISRRINFLLSGRIYRQTLLGTFGIVFAMVIRKL